MEQHLLPLKIMATRTLRLSHRESMHQIKYMLVIPPVFRNVIDFYLEIFAVETFSFVVQFCHYHIISDIRTVMKRRRHIFWQFKCFYPWDTNDDRHYFATQYQLSNWFRLKGSTKCLSNTKCHIRISLVYSGCFQKRDGCFQIISVVTFRLRHKRIQNRKYDKFKKLGFVS